MSVDTKYILSDVILPNVCSFEVLSFFKFFTFSVLKIGLDEKDVLDQTKLLCCIFLDNLTPNNKLKKLDKENHYMINNPNLADSPDSRNVLLAFQFGMEHTLSQHNNLENVNNIYFIK